MARRILSSVAWAFFVIVYLVWFCLNVRAIMIDPFGAESVSYFIRAIICIPAMFASLDRMEEAVCKGA